MINCLQARDVIKNFCQYANTKNGSGERIEDPEDLNAAFFHIYYCWSVECGELWSKLNETERNPSIRRWIEKWTYNPMATYRKL